MWLGGGGNTTVLTEGARALLVDPKMLGFSRRLRHEVEEDLGRQVQRMVLTHSHFDHAGGAGEFRRVGAVLVHPRARARLLGETAGTCTRPGLQGLPQGPSWDPPRSGLMPDDPDPALPLCALPWVEVARDLVLLVGGEEVRIWHPGVGHTDGDLVAHVPARKLLIAGDLVLNGLLPRIDEDAGGDALRFRETLDRVLELDFHTVVPGHGDVGGRELVQEARDYLAALEADVRGAMARGLDEDAAAKAVALRPEFRALRPIPGESHGGNVRLMYRAVGEAAMKAAP